MSRSYKKANFSSNTKASSERHDKSIWHGRMRARQRDQLSNLEVDQADAICPVQVCEVSNPWDMAKDGRHYWPVDRQIKTAKRIASRKASNDCEYESIVERLLAKWHSK